MPGIKHIKIPEPIAIVNTLAEGERQPVLENGKQLLISFRRFVLLALEAESFRKSAAAFRSGEKLAELVENHRPGDVVAVAEDDLTRLTQAVEDRSVFGYVNWILRQLRPLFAALEGAKDRAEDFEPSPVKRTVDEMLGSAIEKVNGIAAEVADMAAHPPRYRSVSEAYP